MFKGPRATPAYIALFAVLTAVGGLIVIPLPFVPITLQTLFCLLAGAVLGKSAGALSQLFYILLGAAGLPVFSKGASGIGVLAGPTGGYIFGFVAGAYICGYFTERNKVLAGMAAGTLVIYAAGIVQLKFVTELSWLKAFSAGVLPFIPGGIIKIAVGVGVYKKLKGIIVV
ncbi:MAG: biotin transporter BioY [Elusimicrobia bacterium]|jgi:biotin transport system substrate-specific component|nr:biotin transporter BioY [Elusimicrobiota bacterium]